MKRPSRTALLLSIACAGLTAAELPLIPRPAKVAEQSGDFLLRAGATVGLENFAGSGLILQLLNDSSKLGLTAAPAGAKADITFVLKTPDSGESEEAYRLEITGTGVRLTGGPAGLYYGAQSLAQILSGAKATGTGATLDRIVISDAPRFAWRGYMLDESRHFSGETAVKRLLDAMARYKLNRFHWHLTDSSGWRIEIRKYPKLTSVGARGDETHISDKLPAQFYTQERIRDIIAYAKARHITVIPEIDMPGHADAAVKAYPENDGGGFFHKGERDKWPRFTFNPAKPGTLAFLDDILDEVAGLFPDAGVIHFGGDEVNFGWGKWPELPEVRELMKRENLKDNTAVETWFNRRMAAKINALGFHTGGWDEIVGRGLPTDKTVVFWWRHDKERIVRAALDSGAKVVLCPRRPLYFDFIQDKSHKSGRVWGGFNPLADVYDFPAGLKLTPAQESHVLGLQACLWTEQMITQERRDFMTWPRLVAAAESGWTPAARKDYAGFETRLKAELPVLRARGINTYDPFANSPEVIEKRKARVTENLDNPE